VKECWRKKKLTHFPVAGSADELWLQITDLRPSRLDSLRIFRSESMRGILYFFVYVVFTCAPCCLAQDASTGAIRGTVVDPANRRIVGATIALVNDATGFRYSQISDST
jgi:hypothetical protein